MINDDFSWKSIYNYYYQKGLTVYILECLFKIISSLVIAFTPILLFGCLNWEKMDSAKTISEIILPFPKGWMNSNIFFKISFILFLIYSLILIIQFVSTLPLFISLHKYYSKKLGLSDKDLIVIEWNEVVESIIVCDPLKSISTLSIAQQITREDNYLGGMVEDQSVFTWRLPWKKEMEQLPMNSSFFYFLKMSLQGTIFNSDGVPLICGVQNIQAAQNQQKLKSRFRIVGVLMILIAPFALIYEILNTIFAYIESIRASPDDLSLRQLSPIVRFKAREFNELPHTFDKRVMKSYEWADLYLDQFNQSPLVPVMRTFSFLAGSIIAIVFFVGIISDIPKVLGLEIFGGKTIAWLITILASVYAACKPPRPPTNMYGLGPDELFVELQKHIHLDLSDSRNSPHSWETYDNVDRAYPPIWKHALINIASVIINPFLFIAILPLKASSIVEFVRRNSVENSEIGWICALGAFEDPQRYSASPEHRARLNRSNAAYDSNKVQIHLEPIREDSNDLLKSIYGQPAEQTPEKEPMGDENLVGFGIDALSPNEFYVPENDAIPPPPDSMV
ncbi:autophagy protein, putative [Trichomonas vaginalis G3]|uniref:Autophagy-related protein 9 n=1 Tax=Trichomonas vaginalis (strain ATCC PRA-98 / G3) TaxID=412133 RepID=A2DYS3_TRIV3|nr:process utilizing autophagic mechanism [Trichomonas vaginalis G3]EAY14463.1 autophagy protein, putative [Trichomonas vaginalis G3]KAI5519643.1 process utilizing autophagic mechanism [Trichomonas vaginalis G3]|eukprot:XP_001326686.1 autophagy protein [Trichomonas vaginalis G3]